MWVFSTIRPSKKQIWEQIGEIKVLSLGGLRNYYSFWSVDACQVITKDHKYWKYETAYLSISRKRTSQYFFSDFNSLWNKGRHGGNVDHSFYSLLHGKNGVIIPNMIRNVMRGILWKFITTYHTAKSTENRPPSISPNICRKRLSLGKSSTLKSTDEDDTKKSTNFISLSDSC